MKNKFLLSLLFSVVSLFAFGQINQQYLGTPKSTVVVRHALKFNDTSGTYVPTDTNSVAVYLGKAYIYSKVGATYKWVRAAPDVDAAIQTQVAASVRAIAWGDSHTFGPGSWGYPYILSTKTGFNFINAGVSGENSTQIRARFEADPSKWLLPTVIFSGSNNINSLSTVYADVAAMVALLPHNNYIIVGPIGNSASTSWSGTGTYNNVIAANVHDSTTYTTHYVNAWRALVESFVPNSPDTFYHNRGVPPMSLHIPGDSTHYGVAGETIIANAILAKINQLSYGSASPKLVSTDYLNTIFASPGGIGTVTPADGKFAHIGIGALSDFSTGPFDGIGSVSNPAVLNVAGQGSFMHRYPSANPGGIFLQEGYAGIGNYATMSLTGSNLSLWNTPQTGIMPRNDVRQFDIGSNISLTGNMAATSYTGGSAILTGAIYAATFSVSDPVTHVAGRPVDFSVSGAPFLWPILSQTAINAVTPKVGDAVYNSTTRRFMVATEDGPSYGTASFHTVAQTEDIPAGGTYAVLNAPNTLTGLQTITGSNATNTAGSTQKLISLYRPASGGVSYEQSAGMSVGAYATTGDASPKTRFQIDLSTGFNTTSPYFYLDNDGSMSLPGMTGGGTVPLEITAAGKTQRGTYPVTYWTGTGSDIYNSNAGNVGIGTAGAPSQQFQITKNQNDSTLSLITNNSTGALGQAGYKAQNATYDVETGIMGTAATAIGPVLTGAAFTTTTSNVGYIINTSDAAGKIKFATNGTVRMEISPSGSIKFNGLAAVGGAAEVQHVSDINGDITIRYLNYLGLAKVVPDANYTVTHSDAVIILPTTTAPRTFTLPAASGYTGTVIIVKVQSATTGDWVLSGSYVPKTQTGTPTVTTNGNMTTAQTFHFWSVADQTGGGSTWYDLN